MVLINFPIFFSGAVELLKEYSLGYGLWTYRDYRRSIMSNGSFSLGDLGYQLSGDGEFITEDNNNTALLVNGTAELAHTKPIRYRGERVLQFCLTVKADEQEDFTIDLISQGVTLQTMMGTAGIAKEYCSTFNLTNLVLNVSPNFL